MKDIKELIYAAVEENALKFQELLNSQLQVRAYDAIEALRPEIGASMFGESSHKKMDDDEDEEDMEDEDEDEDEMDDKKKSMKEALHPNQQKIDVVDDEKIDAKDFAKLRKMKEEVEQIDEAASHEDVVAYADKKLKGWKKTTKHIPKPRRMEDGDPHSSYTYVHPKSGHTVQLHQLHADKKRTQITLGKTDKTGDLKAHKGGEGIPHTSYPITKMPKNSDAKAHIDAALEKHNQHMNEEVEQIDEIGDTPAGRAALGKLATARNARARHLSGIAQHPYNRGSSDETHFNKLANRDRTVAKKAADKAGVSHSDTNRGNYDYVTKKVSEEAVNEVAMPKNAADWQALITHQIQTVGHPVATDAQFRAQHGKDMSKKASLEPGQDKMHYAAAQGGTVKA